MDRDAIGHELTDVLRRYGIGGAVIMYREGTSLVTLVMATNPVDYACFKAIGEVCVGATESAKGPVNEAVVGELRKIASGN